MSIVRFSLRALVIALAFAYCPSGAAQAQVDPREPNPAMWLKSIYDLYIRAEKDEKLQRQANDRLIEARASKSLAALFRKEHACQKETGGVCALDWDYVVNGQDNKLSDVIVAPAQIAGDKASVVVAFRNFESTNRNAYFFVKEGGAWKVEDVETKSGADEPVRIAKILREYKP